MTDTSHHQDHYGVSAKLVVRVGPDRPESRAALAMDESMWSAQSRLQTAAKAVLDNEEFHEELKPVMDLIKWLDFKMDLVLHYLRREDFSKLFPEQILSTDLSGWGVGLARVPALAGQQSILFLITLPDAPARPVFAAGRVLWSDRESAGDEAACGVVFDEISEMDRERVIRFTFQQQRRMLADRKKEVPG